MFVFYGHVELLLPHSTSLKDKRRTILSIIARISRRFNISISEVAYQDRWQRSALGFAAVCNQYSDAELMVSSIRDVLDQHEDTCDILDFDYEVNKYPLFNKILS